MEYKIEKTLVVEYIDNLNLIEYIGDHRAKHVVVLADSGYDDRKIENAPANLGIDIKFHK